MNPLFLLKEGNSSKYDVDKVRVDDNSVLKGKRICFLGSSVTKGFGSLDVSFAEFLAKENGFSYTKEAVNGTTLVNDKKDSYVNRLYDLDKNERYDCFVVQLSTNDASKGKEFGEPSSIDDKTVCGAINTIISYIEENYHCPILFYTNPYYENERYKEMVSLLHEIEKKRNIVVLDLYSDQEFNERLSQNRSLYMVDDIHPTKAGYLKMISPKMKEKLFEMMR